MSTESTQFEKVELPYYDAPFTILSVEAHNTKGRFGMYKDGYSIYLQHPLGLKGKLSLKLADPLLGGLISLFRQNITQVKFSRGDDGEVLVSGKPQ